MNAAHVDRLSHTPHVIRPSKGFFGFTYPSSRYKDLRAISKIKGLRAALLMAGLTLACSPDSPSGGGTGPQTSGPAPPPATAVTFVDVTSSVGFGGGLRSPFDPFGQGELLTVGGFA